MKSKYYFFPFTEAKPEKAEAWRTKLPQKEAVEQ